MDDIKFANGQNIPFFIIRDIYVYIYETLFLISFPAYDIPMRHGEMKFG